MNVGILASTDGPTLQSILDAFVAGRLDGRVAVVVSNNSETNALRRARQAAVHAVHLSSQTHEDPAALDAAIRDVLIAAAVDVVFLAQYPLMRLGPLVSTAFKGRVLSTDRKHLPAFDGPWIFKDGAFEALLAAGEVESSLYVCQAHTGSIVRQCIVPVLKGDSVKALQARVRAREEVFVVETLGLIAKGDIRLGAGAG